MFGLGEVQVTCSYSSSRGKNDVRNWNIPFLFANPSIERRAHGNEVEKTEMKRRRIDN